MRLKTMIGCIPLLTLVSCDGVNLTAEINGLDVTIVDAKIPCDGKPVTVNHPWWIRFLTADPNRKTEDLVVVHPMTPAQTRMLRYSCGGEDEPGEDNLTFTVTRTNSANLTLELGPLITDSRVTLSSTIFADCASSSCEFGVPLSGSMSIRANATSGDCEITCGDQTQTGCTATFSIPADESEIQCSVVSTTPSDETAVLTIPNLSEFRLNAPPHVLCSADRGNCTTTTFPAQVELTLTDSNSVVTSWGPPGNACVNGSDRSVVVSLAAGDDLSCAPVIEPKTTNNDAQFQIELMGMGMDGGVGTVMATGISLNCAAEMCTGSAMIGSTVRFEAMESVDSQFLNWGACANQHQATGPVLEIEVTEALAAQGTISCVATFGPRGGCGPDVMPPVPDVRVLDEQQQEVAPVNGVYNLIQTRTYIFDATRTVFDGDEGDLRWELELDGVGPVPTATGGGLIYQFAPLEHGVVARQTGNINITPIACNRAEGDFITINWKAN